LMYGNFVIVDFCRDLGGGLGFGRWLVATASQGQSQNKGQDAEADWLYGAHFNSSLKKPEFWK